MSIATAPAPPSDAPSADSDDLDGLVERIVDGFPPLDDAQKARLGALLALARAP